MLFVAVVVGFLFGWLNGCLIFFFFVSLWVGSLVLGLKKREVPL